MADRKNPSGFADFSLATEPPQLVDLGHRSTFLERSSVITYDPDSLRRQAIASRRRAREAANAELRHQLLEIAETYEDLADMVEGVHRRASIELAAGN